MLFLSICRIFCLRLSARKLEWGWLKDSLEGGIQLQALVVLFETDIDCVPGTAIPGALRRVCVRVAACFAVRCYPDDFGTTPLSFCNSVRRGASFGVCTLATPDCDEDIDMGQHKMRRLTVGVASLCLASLHRLALVEGEARFQLLVRC